MGFFDLFSKEGRDSARSKLEYDECDKARKARLLSFRTKASRDILFRYPDARMLVNRLDRRFMVLARTQRRLAVGKFADDYLPALDYVDDFASTGDRQASVARFRQAMSRCKGNISEEARPRFENACKWLNSGVTESFATHGYSITGGANLDHVIGGALFLNGKRIAMASIWEPKPRGYFGGRLLEEVIHKTSGPGVQVLTFVTADNNPIGEGQKMGYEIIFDRSLNYFHEGSRREFAEAITGLRDFLYEFDDLFRPDSPGLEDRLNNIHPAAAEFLETADRDEDESIESRYLL